MSTTMGPAANADTSALRLAERLIQLLDRGGFVATYKYAVLVGLIDLAMERTTSTGLPPTMVTTRELAEKIIELYWCHCVPYHDPDRKDGKGPSVLYQSTSGDVKQPLIVRHILDFRAAVDPRQERSLPLSRARSMANTDRYEQLVRDVEWTLIHMPLPRLQRIGRQEDRFLYEYNFTEETPKGAVTRYQNGQMGSFDNRLNFQPGVGAALIALNGLLRPLVYRSWTRMVASMNGLPESKLEDFLFGEERISLEPVRADLVDLQSGKCFYCEKTMPSACEIDHFVPWSRYSNNSIDNLVAAHKDCNGTKSDFLAAAEHVERWRGRSRDRVSDLAQIADTRRWESQPGSTLSVARAIYGMLPDDTRLWRRGSDFVVIDRARILAALAA